MAKDHEIEIERGRKIPKRKTDNKYPWNKLLPGESFRLDLGDEPDKVIGRLRHAVVYANKAHYPKRFITRVIKEEGIIRCWRKA